ncbi:tryptophan--tRNA ligase [Aerococcaceae bacterium DSM 111022]|nr:tryptophan--tRNA ligase [Aerococcaceae bacterium DSM 111022]
MKQRIFSGVQPSGTPTIGNYIGAMRGFVELQDDYEAVYCVVNQHAITVPQDPEELRHNTKSLTALYLAMGIDPNKSIIFKQSDVPAHSQAAWLIQCNLGLGELERMTQYKDKASKQESIGAGLLTYPALMVGDIILYDAELVPVGDDQRQHIELTRDFVDKFNGRFGKGKDILVKPEGLYPDHGARVMSLQDPTSKMSKSDKNTKGFISLLDTPKQITKKIKSAMTDSIGEVNYDKENQPAVSNLLEIYSSLSMRQIDDIVNEYQGTGYGAFKSDLADLTVSTIAPIQERYNQLMAGDDVEDIIRDGAVRANEIASVTLDKMERAMGIR